MVEVFEAMTSSRPYQPARSPNEALRLLRRHTKDGRYRHDLFDAFASMNAA
jgi:HD-GYP domain-containing protein (c-di-GMP phosphodiesterase class II)